jgi:GNAT superfamily N-acetyltransferase
LVGARIRSAGPDDAAGIADVQHASWQTAYLGVLPHEVLTALDQAQGAAFWHRVLSRAGAHEGVLIALLEEEPVGFVSFGPIRERIPGYQAEFYALYVRPEAQGCGIGTALMARAARELVRRRCLAATVWVLEDNQLGRRFYEHLGGDLLTGAKPLHYRGRSYEGVREVAYGWRDLRRARWLVEN